MSHAMTATPSAAASGAPMLEIRDLEAWYGESHVLHGVGLDIRPGEVVTLLGRNGAGKTSTLRAIARLGNPRLTHAEIWLDHQPLHKMNAWQASQAGIALVPEDRRIIAGLTVEET